MNERWYDKSVEQTAERLKTDINTGLSREAVKNRRRRVGKNEIFSVPKTSFKTYLRQMLTDFTSVLLLLTVIVASFFERRASMAAIAVMLVLYYAVAIFAYVKAQRVLEGMGRYALPNAKVMRGGRLYMVKQEQLVQGDIIFLSAGDIVPCDARIIESEGLEALENNVTSVARAVKKDGKFISYQDISPAQQLNMLFASTILTEGTCKAIVCGVGDDTLVCKMRKNVPVVNHERLAILESLKKFMSLWALIMTGAVIVLTALDVIIGTGTDGIFDIFSTSLSLAAASMSEFYAAFAYIILACGIFNAVKKYHDINAGALMKNTSKLDTIKDLTCLIVPKEGVFSIRDMCIEKVWANGDLRNAGERGYERNCSRVLRYALLSTGLYGSNHIVNMQNGNAFTSEEEAILTECDKYGIYNIELDRTYPLIEHISAGSRSRFDTTLTSFDNTHVVAVRGEYNSILDNCRYYIEEGRVYDMTPEKRHEIKVNAALMIKEAYRVVAVASKDTIYNNMKRLSSCQSDLIFEGFLAIREPLLPGAAKNVSKFNSAGIKVIMVCPDVSEHNTCLAKTLGVVKDDSEVITGAQICKMSEDDFRDNAGTYRLYEGLDINQKRFLLHYLKSCGEKVGVLGAELEDIILLKDADVSYSQSITISGGKNGIDLTDEHATKPMRRSAYGGRNVGCEALKFVSDVIISEADKRGSGGINAIMDSIMCAGVIYRNFLRMTRYMITSQLARLFIVMCTAVLGESLMSPAQILFCRLVVDFLAIMIIAFERPNFDILYKRDEAENKLGQPLRSNPQSIILGLFWAVAALLTARLMVSLGVISGAEQISTCIFLSFIFSQIVALNESMKEKSIFIPNITINTVYLLSIVFIALFILLSFVFPGFGAFFGIAFIPSAAWIGILAVPALLLIVCEIYKIIVGLNKN